MQQNKSIWLATANHYQSFPHVSSDMHADVVVIGAGISGLTAALLLTAAGKNVILVEARKLGQGTTGNSTGNLYVTVDEHLSSIRTKWGASVMKEVAESRSAAIDLIESLVREHNVDCDFRRVSFTYYSEKKSESSGEFLRKEKEALIECGLSPQSGAVNMPFPVTGTLSIPNQAQFHPLNYVTGLAEKLRNRCRIFEDSPAEDYDEQEGTVKVNGYTLRAEHIIMATHVPKGLFAVHTVLGSYREFGVARLQGQRTLEPGIYWSIEQPKHSIRPMRTGDKEYVMVIGDKFKTGHHGNTADYINGLENYLSERLSASPTEVVWGGQQYKPADGLPFIGKNFGKLYYLTGFATDGLVYGTLGAMIICDEILGKQNKYAHTYRTHRITPIKSAKNFVKENLQNFAEYRKNLPGVYEEKHIADVKAGEGKVVEENGKKLAVYRDEAGTPHVCSAVCPHLFCIVNWNGAEKSWDCPCHGSRFSYDGSTIEGPAISGLAKVEGAGSRSTG